MYDRKIIEENYPLVLTDPKAANDFFREIEKMLRQLIYTSRKTSGLYYIFMKYHSLDDLNDLIQDCQMSLWEKMLDGQFKDINRIEGYVLGIAKNILLNILKKNSSNIENDFEEINEDTIGATDVKIKKSTEELDRISQNYLTTKFKRVNNREVSQFNTKFVFVRSYKNIAQASQESGVDITAISRCCRHIRKTAGGYIWLFSDDEVCQLFEF